MALLEVRDLQLEYSTDRGPLRAVDGISFDLEEGEADDPRRARYRRPVG